MRVGILTGGGDAPGLNAAIRAVATLTLANGGSVVQVRDGWKGLVGDGDLVELDATPSRASSTSAAPSSAAPAPTP